MRSTRPVIQRGVPSNDGTKCKNMFYIYILLLSNKHLYTGYTSDLKRRIKQHQNGDVKSTKYKRPLRLIHYESYIKKSDAKRRERFLKTTEGKHLLKMQIRDLLNEIIS